MIPSTRAVSFAYRAPLSHRFEEVIDRIGELVLDLYVSHFATTVAALQIFDLGPVRVEQLVIDEILPGEIQWVSNRQRPHLAPGDHEVVLVDNYGL